MRLIIIAIFFFCNVLALLAQNQILDGGTFNGIVRWHGIIKIRGDITISKTGRLVIAPGTKVLFEPNTDLEHSGKDKDRAELIVRGILIARGKMGQKVLFSSAAETPRMADWHGIEFLNVKNQSILDYCIVEYGYNGITIKKSMIQVSNSEIRYNFNAGIKIDVKAKPKIARNIISENDYAGIICTLGAKPVLTDNLITLNRMGLVLFSLSEPNLGFNTQGPDYNPGRNRILNNDEYNLYNHSSKKILAENNSWGETNFNSIAQSIFDGSDNIKYGKIDFYPVFKLSAQDARLGQFLLLAQNNSQSAPQQQTLPEQTQSTINQPSPQNDAGQNQNTPAQQPNVAEADSQKAALENKLSANLDQIANLNISRKENDQVSPPLASARPEETLDSGSDISKENIVNQIDYEKIFLEPFIDGGKKAYLKKVSVKMTRIIRESVQPGAVRIKVVVNKNGGIENANVLKGINPVLNEAALAAVRKFRYKPAKLNGRSVRFSTMEVFVFK